MQIETPELLLSRMSEFVSQAMGWDYPPPRHADLRRGIASAARELGLESAAEFAHQCLAGAASKSEMDRLASHLTVGETYFLRESKAFENLATDVLPKLATRLNWELRIWSAGCCTGEEPYSIAILLREFLPDWRRWKIAILATDINQKFLRKAEAGIFGEWSFRGAPAWLKARYFHAPSEGRFEILPEIAETVRFAQLNLAADDYSSVLGDFGPMDVILCRNVLMYFRPTEAQKVIDKLYRAQSEGGWLIAGASELSHTLFSPYLSVNQNGSFLYQKRCDGSPMATREIVPVMAEPPHQEAIEFETQFVFSPKPEAASVVSIEPPDLEPEQEPEFEALSIEARSFADQGNLTAALGCCDRWIAADKLNPASHYLRSVVLQEQGALLEAAQSLRRALYLDPDHVLAHFAMGNLARSQNQHLESRRHLSNALRLLKTVSPHAVLPESDGVTAARLAEIIGSLTQAEVEA
ncbi:MAG TPA: CheR family methyltransferase [Tepidisphaeraceae bacterium]